MDLNFFTHPSFLLFAGVQAGIAVALFCASELVHRRMIRRSSDERRARTSRVLCRATLAVLVGLGLTAFAAPAYHPLLGEHYLREALSAVEREQAGSARSAFSEAVHHLSEVDEVSRSGSLWGDLVSRFVEPWGGPAAVRAALGTAHFMLGDCSRALPYVRTELAARPSGSRTALLSYRLAVCHLERGKQSAAEEALLRALLIDRRYAQQASRHPRLKPLAEALLSKRL